MSRSGAKIIKSDQNSYKIRNEKSSKMNSELLKCKPLLENLCALESLTRRFEDTKLDDYQCLEEELSCSTDGTLTNIIGNSRIRALNLSKQFGLGDKFSIINLYDSMRSYVLENTLPQRIIDRSERTSFTLEKVTVKITNQEGGLKEEIRGVTGGSTRKRTYINNEIRRFLEKAFHKKRNPTRSDRAAIAQKCGLTPLQVRVWFTNKRMRSKSK